MDILGHINNTVLPIWFEHARTPLIKLFSPDLEIRHETWPLIMAHMDFDFVGELFFRADIEIRTVVSHIGTKSFTLYHEAWQEGRLGVKGNAVIVYYDFLKKETVPIPDDKRKLLEEHLQV
jgi:acyl-CoA thioester hydrolase